MEEGNYPLTTETLHEDPEREMQVMEEDLVILDNTESVSCDFYSATDPTSPKNQEDIEKKRVKFLGNKNEFKLPDIRISFGKQKGN